MTLGKPLCSKVLFRVSGSSSKLGARSIFNSTELSNSSSNKQESGTPASLKMQRSVSVDLSSDLLPLLDCLPCRRPLWDCPRASGQISIWAYSWTGTLVLGSFEVFSTFCYIANVALRKLPYTHTQVYIIAIYIVLYIYISFISYFMYHCY